MSFAKCKAPFSYENKHDFKMKLTDWIGQVFYDLLPQHGYEIREEQIYTAFQMADSVCRGNIHFAEAGLGTGKTFAYLLTALAYARFKGQPALISCASTALQEQLLWPQGDIEKLSMLLGLDIDARMAKDPGQYICDVKVNLLDSFNYGSSPEIKEVLDWAQKTRQGARSEIPNVPDQLWKEVAWDKNMDCETCRRRGFCKQVKAREYYRRAADFVICEHKVFFSDLWTREERIYEGKTSILPKYSMAVFDEGHKVFLPAALSAGRQIVREEIAQMLWSIEKVQGARTSMLSASLALDEAAAIFFKLLYMNAIEDERTTRLTINITKELLQGANTFRKALDIFQFELQNEQELHHKSLSHNRIQSYEAIVERAVMALNLFGERWGEGVVIWAERTSQVFWVVPRELNQMLNKQLYAKGLPIVFSSATLSTRGNFNYLARTLGVNIFSSSSVKSPFNYEEQVEVYIPQNLTDRNREKWFSKAIRQVVSLLELSQGRALILTNAPSEVKRIRTALKKFQLPYEFLWEGKGERGYLIKKFKEEVSSVLVGSGFWEGIDVPGEALTLLIIWGLPFPPQDPLIKARRLDAQHQGLDPAIAVDYPEMGLRLKQGCGRLIRTRYDRGAIAILEPVLGEPWEQEALAALPEGAKIVYTPAELTTLY